MERSLPVDGSKVPYARLQELRHTSIRNNVLDDSWTANDIAALHAIADKGTRLARDFGVEESDGATFERLHDDIHERLQTLPAYQSAVTFFGPIVVEQEVQTLRQI